jgi:hypothetical protein
MELSPLLSPLFFTSPFEMAVKTCTKIYIYIGIFIKVVENLSHYTLVPLWPQPQRVRILGPRLDMWLFPNGGNPSQTVMTAFSSGYGVVSLLSGLSSSSVPQVRDAKVRKLRIMTQSLSLCLTGYAWFGQASSRTS